LAGNPQLKLRAIFGHASGVENQFGLEISSAVSCQFINPSNSKLAM
jgi:hypothetical protein